MKLVINESIIKAAAKYTGGNFSYFWTSDREFDQVIGESIVDWVESINGDYCARFNFVKSLFPNFTY